MQPDSAALADLHEKGAAASRLPGAYAGELTPQAAWDFARAYPSLVVDVRTAPEWQWTGQPDMTGVAGKLASISWKIAPSMGLNPQFEDQLRASGANENTPLLFLCRTGGRSLDAAIAMTQAGFRHCFNITHGFEGDVNERSQRGEVNGWKASNLPWRQS